MRLDIRAGDLGVDHVELYLTREKCPSCDGRLRPKAVNNKLAGETYFLDGDAMAGTPETQLKLKGGHVVWDLHAGSEDIELPYTVVIGYDANNTVVAAAAMED